MFPLGSPAAAQLPLAQSCWNKAHSHARCSRRGFIPRPSAAPHPLSPPRRWAMWRCLWARRCCCSWMRTRRRRARARRRPSRPSAWCRPCGRALTVRAYGLADWLAGWRAPSCLTPALPLHQIAAAITTAAAAAATVSQLLLGQRLAGKAAAGPLLLQRLRLHPSRPGWLLAHQEPTPNPRARPRPPLPPCPPARPPARPLQARSRCRCGCWRAAARRCWATPPRTPSCSSPPAWRPGCWPRWVGLGVACACV